jgi:hypothetical protein
MTEPHTSRWATHRLTLILLRLLVLVVPSVR